MKSFKKGNFSQSQIYQWLLDLRDNAYVPESHFIVTAVFRAAICGEKNYYFGGVNVENVDHRNSLHGEESAIAGMVTGLGPSVEIIKGWVMGAPIGTQAQDDNDFSKAFITCCGKCRQQISGLVTDDAEIHFVSLTGKVKTTTVKNFLPDHFSFHDMPLISRNPSSTNFTPSAKSVEKRLMRRGLIDHQEIKSWLNELQSIDYISKVSQSAIIRLDNGFYVAGTKMEEAAFQSLTAPQTALAIATSEFGVKHIEEVFILTQGRDNKKLPPDTYGTLSMSALQTILQTATHNKILIHFFNDNSDVLTLDLHQAAAIAPSGQKIFYKP